jgi:hypothetical protein
VQRLLDHLAEGPDDRQLSGSHVGAAVALYALGRHGLGIGFAVISLLNTALATIDRRALMHALR